jgi:hypothetical protein
MHENQINCKKKNIKDGISCLGEGGDWWALCLSPPEGKI